MEQGVQVSSAQDRKSFLFLAGLSQRFAFILCHCLWLVLHFNSLFGLVWDWHDKWPRMLLVQYIKASNAFQRLSMTCLS